MPLSCSEKELRLIRILLTIIAIPVVVLIFRTLKSIFIPLVFAIFLSFVFAPLTSWMRRKKIHISLVMITLLVIIIMLMLGSFLMLSAAANSLATGFPRYQSSIVMRVQEGLHHFDEISAKLDIAAAPFNRLDLSQIIAPGGFSISGAISNLMSTTIDIGWNFILIMIFLLFIVAQDGRLSSKLQKVLGDSDRLRTKDTLANIQHQIQRYLLTKTVISLLTALIGMGLMIAYGVDFVIVCGILLFVLNFIPNIGSIFASGIPMIICYMQSGLDLRTISFSLLIIMTQMLFGNVIEPKVQGDRMNLSPIMVLISLIFWAWVWGIVGMVLAVPITSAINIMLIQIDDKNLISAIISS
ncbi:MAG TPA: AI-2E family transporter [Candidatus Cloacimonadota bacterium]|nr:AI-2E family transporter [Candidatus Cloacimonadota bacterium]